MVSLTSARSAVRVGLISVAKEGAMPHYLIQAAYTPEAWQALVKNPHSRIEAIRPAIERMGGKLVGGWAAFGDYDAILVAELPTSVDAAAIAIAAAAGGSCKAVKTTPLLTAEETVEAIKKASNTGYRPVDASAAAATKR
jgi:uncharacterized protein with GYD domain